MPYNLNGLITEMIVKADQIAEKFGVATISMLIVGAVLALILGLFGYRLIKLFMGIGIGLVGYFAGLVLFSYLQETVSMFSMLPSWIAYILGAVLALIFMILGFSRFSYAMFAMFALAGYYFTDLYLPNHLLLAIAGAAVVALLSVLLVRFSFIVVSSAIGGFVAMVYASAIFPNVGILQLGERKAALWITIGVSVFFVLFQYVTRDRKSKSLY